MLAPKVAEADRVEGDRCRLSSGVGRPPEMIALFLVLVSFVLNAPAHAGSLPPGFQEDVVLSGLDLPTAVRFSPDGRVFVAEKGGMIKVFDSLNDPTPTV